MTNWFWFLVVCSWLTVLVHQVDAGLLDVAAISPQVFVLSGNRNKGNGIWKNKVGGNQRTRMRIVTTETGGEGGGGGGGGGGLLGGLV